jgi:hypothetical protein
VEEVEEEVDEVEELMKLNYVASLCFKYAVKAISSVLIIIDTAAAMHHGNVSSTITIRSVHPAY